MDARTGPDRRRAAADVEHALALEDVDDLVVDVRVKGRASRRDRPHELRHVAAADVLVDEVAELAVLACPEGRPVSVADGHGAAAAVHIRRRRDGDEYELVRALPLQLVLLAGEEEGARARFDAMRLAVRVQAATARDDVEELVPALRRASHDPALPEAQDA